MYFNWFNKNIIRICLKNTWNSIFRISSASSVASDLALDFIQPDLFGDLVDDEGDPYGLMERIKELEKKNKDKDNIILQLQEEIKRLKI